MEKTVTPLVKELKGLSTEIRTDKDLANVASVSAGACVCVCVFSLVIVLPHIRVVVFLCSCHLPLGPVVRF